jgi:phosphoribosylformylglycinamidine cyclo-ligase
MTSRAATYKDAGVDIDASQDFLKKIKPLVKKTDRPEVLSSIGHYAGLFALNKEKYRDPVLVASTDGIGTKLKLAIEYGTLSGLGQDLVAMSANDILCMGAEPLFFLDYFATGKLDAAAARILLDGITTSCREINCALLGGETAQMPALYRKGEFDLAGFIVGVVEREELIDGSSIAIGNRIVGIASSGPHSNGFSLIRKILSQKKVPLGKKCPPLNRSLGEVLLEPTSLYVRQVLALKPNFKIKGIAHITGGGLTDNLPRILPDRCRAVLSQRAWPRPPLFDLLQKWGKVSEEEMRRTFNLGVGLMLVVPSQEAEAIVSQLKGMNHEAWIIGEIVERKPGERPLEIL